MASEMYHLAVLKNLLVTDDYSDLVLKCGGREFKVHKNIVCSQCKPIAAAMNPQFTEGATGVFEFCDDDPINIDKMVNFLYTGSYNTSKAKVNESDQAQGASMLDSAQMYIFGDKWDVSALRSKAETDFRTALMNDWDLDQFITSLGLIYSELPGCTDPLKVAAIEHAGSSGDIVDGILASNSYAVICDANQPSQIGNDLLRAHRQALKQRTTAAESETTAPEVINQWCKRCNCFRYKERNQRNGRIAYRCKNCSTF